MTIAKTTQRLLNIRDPKELEAELDKLSDVQLAQYKKTLKNGLMFARSSFNYIKRRHRLYLWLFPMQVSVDYHDRVQTKIYYKIAFGHYFLMNEFVRKYGN